MFWGNHNQWEESPLWGNFGKIQAIDLEVQGPMCQAQTRSVSNLPGETTSEPLRTLGNVSSSRSACRLALGLCLPQIYVQSHVNNKSKASFQCNIKIRICVYFKSQIWKDTDENWVPRYRGSKNGHILTRNRVKLFLSVSLVGARAYPPR